MEITKEINIDWFRLAKYLKEASTKQIVHIDALLKKYGIR